MIQTLRQIRKAVKAQYQATGIRPKHQSLLLKVMEKIANQLGDEKESDFLSDQELVQISLQEILNEEHEVQLEVDTIYDAIIATAPQIKHNPKKIEPFLLEFAEKAINKRSEIGEEAYLAYLSETTTNISRCLSQLRAQAIKSSSQAAYQALCPPQPCPIEKQKTFIASIEPLALQIKEQISENLPFKNQIESIAAVIEAAESVLSDFENIIQATERGEIIDTSEDYGFFDLAADYICNDFQVAWNRQAAKFEAISETKSVIATKGHAALNKWKEEAKELCRQEWRNGSNILHNKIVQVIMKDARFETTPAGKPSKDILLREFAKAADEPEFRGRNLKYGTINKK